MQFVVKCLIVGAMLFGSLVNAHAGKRDHVTEKHHYVGLSFSIHVGGPKKINISHMPHRRPVVRGCSPRQVSAIARNYGIRYQTIYRSSRTMTVVGYKNGYFARICFSRAPDCRIIR